MLHGALLVFKINQMCLKRDTVAKSFIGVRTEISFMALVLIFHFCHTLRISPKVITALTAIGTFVIKIVSKLEEIFKKRAAKNRFFFFI